MRALFVVRRLGPGSVRIRVAQHLPGLQAAGIETEVLTWGAAGPAARAARPARLLAAARRADVVVLQKPNLPSGLLAALTRVNPRLVVDVDDAVWAPGGGAAGVAPGRYATRFDAALGVARWAVAGSEHLARALATRRPGLPVEVLRPSVVLADYAPAVPGEGPPTLGWMGGAGNQRDLAGPPLAAIGSWCARHGGRLVVVSDQPPSLGDLPVEFRRWSAAREAADAASVTVGLMPLHDDERSAGRCGFKAIQSLAAGVPVVASPVGAAVEVVGGSGGGILAGDEAAWAAALDQLTADGPLRRRLGEAGRSWVAEEAAIEVTTPRLARLLAEVAAS